MKIAVFDVDDTIIIHGHGSNNYYTKTTNTFFRDLLESKNFDHIYLYTNGTYGHGYNIADHLNISDKVSFIYGRDNLKPILYPKHMKPYKESFDFVNSSILFHSGIYHENSNNHQIYFFDDLKDNLETAKNIGWKTILIKPNGTKESYIDYVFPNIFAALISMNI